MIPITVVRVGDEERELVNQVLDSGSLAQGRMVERFEGLVAEMAGTRHAVAVSNGTLSLVAALQALEIQPGDEVVTSPFTFVASVTAALHVGAKVRFADIDPATFTLDPDRLGEVITDRTRVVMPVHLYGQMADLDRITSVIGDRDIHVLEDAAQAHGAAMPGRRAGSVLGSFSFYATKNVSTGEGGAVTTDDDRIADRLRLLRNQGMAARYQYDIIGYNYRMTDLQAALGIPQMERLEEINATRRANAQRLTEGLSGVDGLTTPAVADGFTHVYHQYTVRIGEGAAVTRDEAVAALNERGIGCGIYYPRTAYDYDCYRSHPDIIISECPEAERAANEAVSLPVHPHLSDSDLDQIISTVRSVVEG